MNVDQAIGEVCAAVGIRPPRSYRPGNWAKCDTLDGRSGKGDGRVMVDEIKVVGWNWKTGEKSVVKLKDEVSPAEAKRFAERRQQDDRQRAERAAAAAQTADALISKAKATTHSYLARKGFPAEKALIVDAAAIRAIGGEYLVPTSGRAAIVIPARIGPRVTSAQLVWEDGTKKFLAGGEIGGASHRVAKGMDTWLCEGLATGLSLRAALKGLNRSDTIICCFSASNLPMIARTISGRCFIAADNDKPLDQFGGKGTGEHYAAASSRPFMMAPEIGTDLNDFHQAAGIFALQRLIADFLRRVPR